MRFAASLVLLALIGCNGHTNARSATDPASMAARHRETVFWSARTGSVAIYEISGDSGQPFVQAPKHVTIGLIGSADASPFRALARAHTHLPYATVDDADDGEYYKLTDLVVLGSRGPLVTFGVRVFHMTCGPPTCATPTGD